MISVTLNHNSATAVHYSKPSAKSIIHTTVAITNKTMVTLNQLPVTLRPISAMMTPIIAAPTEGEKCHTSKLNTSDDRAKAPVIPPIFN